MDAKLTFILSFALVSAMTVLSPAFLAPSAALPPARVAPASVTVAPSAPVSGFSQRATQDRVALAAAAVLRKQNRASELAAVVLAETAVTVDRIGALRALIAQSDVAGASLAADLLVSPGAPLELQRESVRQLSVLRDQDMISTLARALDSTSSESHAAMLHSALSGIAGVDLGRVAFDWLAWDEVRTANAELAAQVAADRLADPALSEALALAILDLVAQRALDSAELIDVLRGRAADHRGLAPHAIACLRRLGGGRLNVTIPS